MSTSTLITEQGSVQRSPSRVGAVDDPLEREADAVADRVMRMPAPDFSLIQRCPGGCPDEEMLHRQPMEEENEEEELIQRQSMEEEEKLQAKELPGHTPIVIPQIQDQINTLRGGGQPLSESLRAFFEPRFGVDFSFVRIHNSSKAAETAHSIKARAFTIGRDIVFGKNDSNTHEGRRLLAHELMHVVQQTGGRQPMYQQPAFEDPQRGHELTHTIQQGPADRSGARRPSMIQRASCPVECLTCPPDGRVADGCECFGLKKPDQVIKFGKKIRVVSLAFSKSASTIEKDVKLANRVWAKAGIEVDADVKEIPRGDTEKILGKDKHGHVRKTVIIEPPDSALKSSTSNILGLVSVPAGRNRDSFVVYYVPDFNQCGDEKDAEAAVGCAVLGGLGGTFSIWIERKSQAVALAHELGHMWGNDHVASRINVMHKAPTKTGLTVEQIRSARASLRLGSMRCAPEGAGIAVFEGITREQQKAERNQALDHALRADRGFRSSRWKGLVLMNGVERESGFLVFKPLDVNKYYYYDIYENQVWGSASNARIEEGAFKFDWKEGSVIGKASFELGGSLDEKPTLKGTWGIGNESNGGTWNLTKES